MLQNLLVHYKVIRFTTLDRSRLDTMGHGMNCFAPLPYDLHEPSTHVLVIWYCCLLLLMMRFFPDACPAWYILLIFPLLLYLHMFFVPKKPHIES